MVIDSGNASCVGPILLRTLRGAISLEAGLFEGISMALLLRKGTLEEERKYSHAKVAASRRALVRPASRKLVPFRLWGAVPGDGARFLSLGTVSQIPVPGDSAKSWGQVSARILSSISRLMFDSLTLPHRRRTAKVVSTLATLPCLLHPLLPSFRICLVASALPTLETFIQNSLFLIRKSSTRAQEPATYLRPDVPVPRRM